MNSHDGQAAGPDPASPGDVYHQQFAAAFEYPVYFTHDVFDPANDLLAQVLDRLGERRRHRAAVYVDSGLADAHRHLTDRIKEYFHARPDQLELACPPAIVPGGEQAKTGWQVVRDVMWTIGNLHLDRQSFIVAVGGGGVLDMVGFACSIVHRGLRLVRVPTTTLAQADAGIGVKNGMDEHGMKNFVGTFAPPFAVLNDFALLPTLTDEHWLGGVAEALKVALIKDAGLFELLRRNAAALRGRDQTLMEQTIRRAAVIHLEHIRTSGDPFEFGSARPLDFGHWAAHKLEVLSDLTLPHGQAVAIGIALDCFCAMRLGLLSPEQLEQILAVMDAAGLPTWSELLAQRSADDELELLAGLEEFREHLGGTLTVTLPDGIGAKREVHHISPDAVAEGVEYLRKRSAGGEREDENPG